jgi:hypothetical protein
MVTIQTNATELIDKLAAIASKQMPFVMAQTLSGLAWDVRDGETSELDRYFKTRTTWTKKSLKVIRAEKRDYPDQSAIVGVRDEILALNITGGQRTSDSGTVAAPGSDTRKLLNPGKETLNAPRFPNKVINSKKTYYGNRPFFLQGKGNKNFIAVRITTKRKPLEILYTLKKSVQVDQNWPFVDNAREIVRSNYAEKFSKNLSKAL